MMCKNGWILLFGLIIFFSCSKETEDKLSGKWQLRQIESEGSVATVDTVWYNFQNTLFSYQLYDTKAQTYRQQYGFNTISDKELLLELEITPEQAAAFLPYTDWEEVKKTFTMTRLKGSELVLTDNRGRTYLFHKF